MFEEKAMLVYVDESGYNGNWVFGYAKVPGTTRILRLLEHSCFFGLLLSCGNDVAGSRVHSPNQLALGPGL